MESKKINQLATEMSPAISDLTIIGDPITGVSKKITLLQIADLFQTTGTVTSVAVTESGNALNITGSPITTAGTINIGFAGSANQYVRGDGALAPFPTSTGGGSSVSYYLNGSVNQGTFGGSTYYQMSKNAIVGTGTNFSISSNGLIAQFITDANDPDVVQIPSGNWNIEFFMNVSASSGALASFYVEFYKYNGSTFTLLATNSATPEELTNTTTVDAYYTSVAMPTSALSVTDRLAIRIYANVASKTVTLYTEDNRLCQVVTTFSKGLASLNNLTDQSQYLTTGTSGTNFAIVSSGDTHTFNLPVASATNTGKLSSTDWSTFNGKVPYTGATANVDLGFFSLSSKTLTANGNAGSSGSLHLKQNDTINVAGINYGTIATNTLQQFVFYWEDASFAKRFNLDFSSLTALGTAKTFTLPDLSGTLALLEGTQTFSGAKTFSGLASFTNTSGINMQYGAYINKGNTPLAFSSGTTNIYSDATTNNIVIRDNSSIAKLEFNNSTQTYTFPAASGTIALTSNIPSITGLVPYTGATTNVNLGVYSLTANQLIAGGAGVNNAGTFTTFDGGVATQLIGSTGNLKFFPFWNPSIGARINAENSAGSAYIPLSFYATTINLNAPTTLTGALSGTSASFSSSVTATSIIKSGGTSSQFLKADGSVDSTSYQPLLTNPITGTGTRTATYIPLFSGTNTIENSSISQGAETGVFIANTLNVQNPLTVTSYVSADAFIPTNSTVPTNGMYRSAANTLAFSTNSAARLTISSTGAATFSSSVTAGGATAIADALLPIQINAGASSQAYFASNNNGTYGLLMGYDNANGYARIRNVSNTALTFETNNSEKVRITSSGNVGIGTSSPSYKLEIAGAQNANDIVITNTTIGAGLRMQMIDAYAHIFTNASYALLFGTNNTERMRITSGGNVGIGTTDTQGFKLAVDGGNVSQGDTTTTIRVFDTNSATTNSGGGISFAGYFSGTSSFVNTFSYIKGGKENSTAGDFAAYLSFGTRTNGGAPTERLRISSDGILKSLPTYNNTTGLGANMQIDSNGFFARSTSSIKYKKNVENYTKGLAEVMQMRPVTYNSINETETQTYAGLIAEEIHELGLTEFVQYAEDGTPDALSYGNMVALLVKSIQEQQAQIEELKALIAAK